MSILYKKVVCVIIVLVVSLVVLVNQSFAVISFDSQTVFSSQTECEQKTGKSCGFQNCDFIPKGKTFEHICGKDFKKGWVAIAVENLDITFPYKWNIDLKYGIKNNPDIKALQQVLIIEKLYRGKTHGNFDRKTRKAVQKFQKKYKLVSNGIVETRTRTKLNELYGSKSIKQHIINKDKDIKKGLTINPKKMGRDLAFGKCDGEGVPYKLSVSPMKPEDFSMIIPYGLMVGNHVTPIDHQYFSPKDYKSARDSYEVRAMADSRLVAIQPRTDSRGTEYRMVFSVTCTFFYYYDLVTSLAPDIKLEYDKSGRGRDVDINVKAGQVIGRIGGQTLDFAVWDTTKKLTDFIVPEHYDEESWKIYTQDPLDYYTDELKTFALSRYLRNVPPVSGKIDYDIDGRLIGNWFLEDTDGYRGIKAVDMENYSKTHLAFAPNHLDPSRFMISLGESFDGRFGQYIDFDNSPDPKNISVQSGMTKFDLAQFAYFKTDGTRWDYNSLASSLRVEPFPWREQLSPVVGCALVEMVEDRKIKFEVFKDSCSPESSFDSRVKIYTR